MICNILYIILLVVYIWNVRYMFAMQMQNLITLFIKRNKQQLKMGITCENENVAEN